jgi:hypothetical protein
MFSYDNLFQLIAFPRWKHFLAKQFFIPRWLLVEGTEKVSWANNGKIYWLWQTEEKQPGY